MANISDIELRTLRQRSIEYALWVPVNNPAITSTPDTTKILQDAETIYNWITKDKEAQSPQP